MAHVHQYQYNQHNAVDRENQFQDAAKMHTPTVIIDLTNDVSDGSPKSLRINDTNKYDQIIDMTNGTITLSRLLYLQELQRKEAANLYFKNMLTKMSSKRAEMMNKFWHKLELEYEKSAQVRRNREMEILKEWELDDQMARIEQEKLNKENRDHSDRMKSILEKQLQSTKLFEDLNNGYSQICQIHEEIANIICSDKCVGLKIFSAYESKLSLILLSTNALIEKCKSGIITSQDVVDMSNLEIEIKNLKTVITEEMKKSSAEVKPPEIPAPAPTAISIATPQPNEPPTLNEAPSCTNVAVKENAEDAEKFMKQYYDKQSYSDYLSLQEYLSNYESSYNDLLKDPSCKKYRFECQKAVNTPVNAISSLNSEHIKDKFEKLYRLLSGETVIVGDNYVSASQHPQGIFYCKSLLASKIVQQGELLVSSNPEAAFPIASVAVALWAKFPDFGKLLCAHFQRRCPYLVPMMLPQTVGQSDEEFYKMRGYLYDSTGSIEKQDKFLKRISGIFKLYSAIWVTKMPYSLKMIHPQSLSFAWRWLGKFVNLNPEVDLSATLLYDFIMMCGFDCYKYYKVQFVKMLRFLLKDYLEELNKIDEGGPKTRLNVLILDIINNGSLKPPKGLQSNNNW